MKVRGFEPVSSEKIAENMRKQEGKPSVYVTNEAVLPKRGTAKSAGYDFCNPTNEHITIHPNEKVLIWTNVKTYMQDNEVLTLVVRSSSGIKKDLILSNTIGVIDADYYNNKGNEGNIGISLRNVGKHPVVIEPKERIAQGIFLPFLVSDNCNSDEERIEGIGSTNK